MKKLILSIVLLCLAGASFSKEPKRHTVYIGCESGLGLSKTKLVAYSDHHFVNPISFKLASTGLHVGFEFFKHGFLEVGLHAQTYPYNHIVHKSPDGGGFSTGGGVFATGSSIRFRYQYNVSKTLSLRPMLGINNVTMQAPSQSVSDIN